MRGSAGRLLFYLVLVVLLFPMGFACRPQAPAAKIKSVPDAKAILFRHGWHVKELGGGVKILTRDTPFDEARAMNAYAVDVRKEIDGVVFISYSDESQRVPGLVSRKIDEVWIIGEEKDVMKCIRTLGR